MGKIRENFKETFKHLWFVPSAVLVLTMNDIAPEGNSNCPWEVHVLVFILMMPLIFLTLPLTIIGLLGYFLVKMFSSTPRLITWFKRLDW